jgi:hypothetical protein
VVEAVAKASTRDHALQWERVVRSAVAR